MEDKDINIEDWLPIIISVLLAGILFLLITRDLEKTLYGGLMFFGCYMSIILIYGLTIGKLTHKFFMENRSLDKYYYGYGYIHEYVFLFIISFVISYLIVCGNGEWKEMKI